MRRAWQKKRYFGLRRGKSAFRPARETSRTGGPKKLWLRLAALCCAAILALAFLDSRLRPVITTMAKYQCRVVSILAMNEAVIDELQKNEEMTAELVHTQRNDDGTVATVEVDSAALNRLKAQLTQAVTDRLLALEKQDIAIPLGTLLGWQLLAGRGPNVHLQVVPASFVQATTQDRLETAGINQTQHSISIHFSVEMSALLPGYSTSITVENDVIVAETLIVGDVPQVYAVTR